MTVALAAIVRDESDRIARFAEGVLPFIDTWLIIDTGSIDDTAALVAEHFGAKPGRLLHRPWVDFGHNRTELLAEAHGLADWLLLLDADMTPHGSIPTDLDRGVSAWLVRYEGDRDYRQALLVSGANAWRYEGRTHEYIDSDLPFTRANLDSLTVEHHLDGASRTAKFERDLDLLTDDDPRSTFYRAQTLRDLERLDEARTAYEERAAMGGWDEEAWFAQWQAASLTLTLDGIDAATGVLLAAWDQRPSRAEPLHALALAENRAGRYHPARLHAEAGLAIAYPADDLLFIDATVYRWGLLLERSIAAGWCGDVARCRGDSLQLLDMDLPPNVRTAAEHNLAWCDGHAVAATQPLT